MKMLLKSKVCGFCEQCMDPLVCTIHEKINNHGLKKIIKKKKKKEEEENTENADACSFVSKPHLNKP